MSNQQPGDPSTFYEASPYREPAYWESPPPYPSYQQPWGASPIVQPIIIANRPTNGKAIASMVLGICFVLTLCSFAFFFPVSALTGLGTGIPAVVLGHMALRQIDRNSGQQGGKEMAITGLVLGYISIVAALAAGAFSIFFFTVFFQTLQQP